MRCQPLHAIGFPIALVAVELLDESVWRCRMAPFKDGQVRGITLPLGPLSLSLGYHRRGAVSISLGLGRRWLLRR